MHDVDRDALLIRLDERTARADVALFGNGGGSRVGITSRVAVLEDDMRRREDEVLALKESVPSVRNTALVNSGVLTAVLVGLFTALKEVFSR